MKGRGLFLDLDNTILDSKGAYNFSLNKISKFWKKEFKENDFLEQFEEVKKEIKKRLHSLPYHRSRLIVFKELIDKKQFKLNSKLLLKLDYLYFYNFKEYINIYKKDNKKNYKILFKILNELEKNTKIFLLTNESLRTQLIKTNEFIPSHLDLNLITSEEVGNEKPSIEYFSYAIDKSKIFTENLTMIGDSLEDDIIGAINSGIKAIQVKSVFGANSYEEGNINSTTFPIFGNTIQALESYIAI
jgi:putative hydrolase of the HAD superfamily